MKARFVRDFAAILDLAVAAIGRQLARSGTGKAIRFLEERVGPLPSGFPASDEALIAESVAHQGLCQFLQGLPFLPAALLDGSSEVLENALRSLPLAGVDHDCDRLFEQLLAIRGSSRRRDEGVYVTPSPVVKYIVRCLDEILTRHFDQPLGLLGAAGNDEIRIIDPACGTGIFFDGVLERLAADGEGNQRNKLAEWFARRCLAMEINPVAALLAQVRTNRRLERLTKECLGSRVTICNPLVRPQATVDFLAEQSSAGRNALAIIGNPPYGIFGKSNRSQWISSLLSDYKRGLGERKINLDDDYIKFLRWAQHWVDDQGCGVVAMITNHGFLTGITHRRMRRSLSESFSHVYVLDLHGSSIKRDLTSAGQRDENIFPIREGVCISLLVKPSDSNSVSPHDCRVHYFDLRGKRSDKLAFLTEQGLNSTPWRVLDCDDDYRFFAHSERREKDVYQSYPSLVDIFPTYISGIQTKNDRFLVDADRDILLARIRDNDGRSGFDRAPGNVVDGVGDRRRLLPGSSLGVEESNSESRADPGLIRKFVTAPLDHRYVYYDRRLVGRSRWRVMQHMLHDNLGFVFARQSTCAEYSHFLVTDCLISDRMFYSAHGTPYLAPLKLYNKNGGFEWNLERRLCGDILSKWDLVLGDGSAKAVSEIDLLGYFYAAVHSSEYRQRFRSQLKIGFPRLPLVRSRRAFRQLCQLGRQLIDAHRMQCLPQATLVARSQVPATSRRGLPRFVPEGPALGTLVVHPQCAIDDVDQASWQLEIGGYRVLKRWLRDRKQEPLSQDQLSQFSAVVQATRATIDLVRAVDDTVDW